MVWNIPASKVRFENLILKFDIFFIIFLIYTIWLIV